MYVVAHKRKSPASGFIFGTPPAEYVTFEDARIEAERLAAAFGDKDFYVFEAKSVSRIQQPPVITELLPQ